MIFDLVSLLCRRVHMFICDAYLICRMHMHVHVMRARHDRNRFLGFKFFCGIAPQ